MSDDKDWTLEAWIPGSPNRYPGDPPPGIVYYRPQGNSEGEEDDWYHMAIDLGHIHDGDWKKHYRSIDMGNRTERWVMCDECGDWYLSVTIFNPPPRLGER